MILVGVLLVSGLALIAVEGLGYVRGGLGSAFWRLSLDDKLVHISTHKRDWWWISVWGLVGMFLVTGGVFGLVGSLADDGAATIARVALGGYVVVAATWMFGLSAQTAAIARAASERSESGVTPAWVHPFWDTAYLTEGFWVIGSNVVYSLLGVAILETSVVPHWAGWVSLIGGALISIGVVVVRDGFPQLGILLPAVIGVALLLNAV